jgi:hypothetical protein
VFSHLTFLTGVVANLLFISVQFIQKLSHLTMDCIKTQNQCINTILFPGRYNPSSYHVHSYADLHNLTLVYIPFKRKTCTSFGYIDSAPEYIPALLAINAAKTVNFFAIHFHGNACDLGQISICANRESVAYSAHYLIVEYPGYGISSGYPNELLMDEIARCVYEFVVHDLHINYQQIVLLGRSIGTGPACSLAGYLQSIQMPPFALILHSPFASIADATSDLLGDCLSYFLLNRWENHYYLVNKKESNPATIQIPVLFLHADNDKIISILHSDLLHQERKKLNLPSEFFVQRSDEFYLKGHNYFDYEKDVVIPTKRFLWNIYQERENSIRMMEKNPLEHENLHDNSSSGSTTNMKHFSSSSAVSVGSSVSGSEKRNPMHSSLTSSEGSKLYSPYAHEAATDSSSENNIANNSSSRSNTNTMSSTSMKLTRSSPIILQKALLKPFCTIPSCYAPPPETLEHSSKEQLWARDAYYHEKKKKSWTFYDIMGWLSCPCLFCTECCCSLNVHFCAECYFCVSGEKKPFSYSSLKQQIPNAPPSGSLFHVLFRRQSFIKHINEEDSVKSQKAGAGIIVDRSTKPPKPRPAHPDVENPLITSASPLPPLPPPPPPSTAVRRGSDGSTRNKRSNSAVAVPTLSVPQGEPMMIRDNNFSSGGGVSMAERKSIDREDKRRMVNSPHERSNFPLPDEEKEEELEKETATTGKKKNEMRINDDNNSSEENGSNSPHLEYIPG